MQVFVGDIEVRIEKKKIKNMHIYIKPPLGEVLCTAPGYVSDKTIREFILSKEDFIIQNVEKMRANPVTLNPTYDDGDKIAVWGEIYTLFVKEGTRYKMELKTAEESLTGENTATMTLRQGCTQEQKEHFITEWYRKELAERVEVLLPQWESYTGLKSSGWQSKNMKTRWGSCNTGTKKIWLSVKLAEHPVECLEYVILHELAHTKVANHGPEFKAILNEYMPEWKEIKRRLNGR